MSNLKPNQKQTVREGRIVFLSQRSNLAFIIFYVLILTAQFLAEVEQLEVEQLEVKRITRDPLGHFLSCCGRSRRGRWSVQESNMPQLSGIVGRLATGHPRAL